MHGKASSRSIFTKLKLAQALIEKAQYYSLQKNQDKFELMYIQSIIFLDSAREQLFKYEQMYSLFDENFKNEIPPEILRQHCNLQAGICHREFLKNKTAIQEFTNCLRQGTHYDPSVREQCLMNIKNILQQEQLLDKAPGLLKLIHNNYEKKQKDIAIILDFSFSMNHKIPYKFQSYDPNIRMDEEGMVSQKTIALHKFLTIFDDFVQNNDRVAFIRFNENVDVIFELNEKGNNTRFLRTSIESQFNIEPAGESAVRQAIYTAYKLFQKTIPKDHSKWIVVFTDGGDSCSKISEPELIDLFGGSDVNIMIIGCGLDKYSTKIYRQLCEKTKNGIFIKTNNKQSEINIAFQAITNKIYGNSDLNFNVEAFQ